MATTALARKYPHVARIRRASVGENGPGFSGEEFAAWNRTVALAFGDDPDAWLALSEELLTALHNCAVLSGDPVRVEEPDFVGAGTLPVVINGVRLRCLFLPLGARASLCKGDAAEREERRQEAEAFAKLRGSHRACADRFLEYKAACSPDPAAIRNDDEARRGLTQVHRLLTCGDPSTRLTALTIAQHIPLLELARMAQEKGWLARAKGGRANIDDALPYKGRENRSTDIEVQMVEKARKNPNFSMTAAAKEVGAELGIGDRQVRRLFAQTDTYRKWLRMGKIKPRGSAAKNGTRALERPKSEA